MERLIKDNWKSITMAKMGTEPEIYLVFSRRLFVLSLCSLKRFSSNNVMLCCHVILFSSAFSTDRELRNKSFIFKTACI